jgi:hypothetical protein
MHVAAFASAELVVFGGERADKPGAAQAVHDLNDLWAYSVDANEWRLLSKSNCKCITDSRLSSLFGHRYYYPWAFLALGTVFAAFMVWANHRNGQSGGERVFDYCRPRLMKPRDRAASAVASALAVPKVVVQMAVRLAAGAAGAVTRKKGYQGIN